MSQVQQYNIQKSSVINPLNPAKLNICRSPQSLSTLGASRYFIHSSKGEQYRMFGFIKKHIANHLQKTASASTPTEKDCVQYIDYEKLTSAIVSANQITQEMAEAKKIEAHKSDSLSMSLVEMLRLTFGILIGLLILFTVIATAHSLWTCYSVWDTSLISWLVLICWILFYYGSTTMLVSIVNPTSKRHKIIVYSACSSFIISILFALVINFVPHFKQTTLLGYMSISMFAFILIGFLFIIIRAIKNETDRNFLASYFSAIMATAALIATIVFSLIQLQ